MAGSYVPDAGDIVWVSFNPQAGPDPRSAADMQSILDRVFAENL